MSSLELQSSIRIARLFLHFFDVHFLEMKNVISNKSAAKECNLATRFALLASEEVLVPAASYFESPICRRILDAFRETFEFGLIRLVGSGASLEEFIESKLRQYPSSSALHKAYIKAAKQKNSAPPFKSRNRSATRDIKNEWYALPNRIHLPEKLNSDNVLSLPTDLEEKWVKVPEQLETLAFIVPHVEKLFFGEEVSPIARSRLHQIINEAYFRSYTEEFESGVVRDLVFLESPEPIPSYGQDISFRKIQNELRKRGSLPLIESDSAITLMHYKQGPEWLDSLAAAYLPTGVHLAKEEGMQPIEPQVPRNEERRVLPVEVINEREYQLRRRCRIGIVTALPKEFAAVRAMLDDSEVLTIRGDPNDYVVGKISALDGSGDHLVIVTLLKKMGNNSAAVAAANLLRTFQRIQDILMVGIAGGIPDLADADKHIRLGDVVVSNTSGVLQYDLGKRLDGEFEPRGNASPPSALMQGYVNYLETQRIANSYPWEAHILRAAHLLRLTKIA